MRRRLLLTTALMPVAMVLAPQSARAPGLVPEIDADGQVVAWVDPDVMARLRAALDGRS